MDTLSLLALTYYSLPLIAALAVWWSHRCKRLRRIRARLVEALDDARDLHAIVIHTVQVEFPFLARASLELALFRTYAVPCQSRILARSGQFRVNPGKRFDDTDLFIQEFYFHHVDSERGSTAIRRMNYVHSLFPTIANADFLYTLCAIIVYPIDWCARFAYREWTEKEKLAHFRAWHNIGTRMGLRDIPATIEAAAEYMESYEARNMVYADSNREVAEPVLELFLSDVPKCLRPLGRRLVYAMMDDRLLAALGYPKQPRWLRAGMEAVVKATQGVFTRWFLPPRPLEKVAARVGKLGCPVAAGERIGVRYARFRRVPCVYAETGYRIEELGHVHPGRLGEMGGWPDQALLCPLQSWAEAPWPDCLLKPQTKLAT